MPLWFDHLMSTVQLIISCGTLITLIATLSKFLNKPNVTQNERLSDHDKRFSEIDHRLGIVERRLDKGSEHFDGLDKSTSMIQSSLVTIMDSLLILIPKGNSDRLKEKRDVLLESLINKE